MREHDIIHKPEVQNISQQCHRWSEPWPQATSMETGEV